MKVLVDADACPVTNIVVSQCGQYDVPCLLFCDTAHEFHREGSQTFIVDKGADSVDFALVNQVEPGDIIVTQDYGLASMCMAKNGRVLHQDGWVYTRDNIDALLFTRHESGKYRRAGGRTKGPKKRTQAQDEVFRKTLQQMLQG